MKPLNEKKFELWNNFNGSDMEYGYYEKDVSQAVEDLKEKWKEQAQFTIDNSGNPLIILNFLKEIDKIFGDLNGSTENQGCGEKIPAGFDREQGYPLHEICGLTLMGETYLCPKCQKKEEKE